jgi:hypothetical protein
MSNETTKPTPGDVQKFIEHYCLIRDLDSLSEWVQPVCIYDGANFSESRIEKLALYDLYTQTLLCGNTGESEYMGLTGRTCICKYNEHGHWFEVSELTPATVNLDDLYNIS